ncbi:MAG: S8 family serine peptidase [bacterium]|nr:S8 family serine peptidase [bacterium]
MTAIRFLFALSALVLASTAAAGVLSPGLERYLERHAEDDLVRVLVVLEEQVDAPALARELYLAKSTHPEIHRRVVTTLQETALTAQAGLLAELAAGKASGGVAGYRPHWLVNSVVVTAPVRTVRALADRPDVARIEPDLVVELIEPVAQSPAAATGIGTASGVAAVHARQVWEEFGIDGTGVVVGSLDTGVDGAHPALAGRWRGLTAPPSECWFDAAAVGDTDFPVDRRGHGTHIMGTLVGLAPGDTIGVAPGARWIAANVIIRAEVDEVFDNAVLASLEFMADPDGDPATVDDVPAVVQNSWGVSEDWDGYFDCDSRWWDAIDACEAVGVVLLWSAGNEGSSAGTIRSPADRATTPLNAFAVGSTLVEPPYQVSGFSSRGPSGCGDGTALKPQLMAPGTSIYSAAPGGGYGYQSGTSMAGPHVAGVVALMRAANPTASVQTIKQALLDSAVDLGPTGPDMDYGHGLVDAHAAVLAVMDGVGLVTGRVTAADTGLPLAGAVVERDTGFYRAVAAADGTWRLTLPMGDATFTVTAFGREPQSVTVTVPDGGEVAADAALVAMPTGLVSGQVTGPGGEAIAGAEVAALDTPLAPVLTAPDGTYLLPLPVDATDAYRLRARADGYGVAELEVTVAGAVTRDFVLPAEGVEDFASGDFSAFPWRMGGDAPWIIVAEDPGAGAYSARSGSVADGGRSELSLVYDVLQGGDLTFLSRVSCEEAYDHLVLYVDGVLRRSWTGEMAWSAQSVALDAGRHELRWVYVKDDQGSAGADAAWLDLLAFPPSNPVAAAAARITPAAVHAVLAPEAVLTVELLLDNDGNADLDWAAHLSRGAAAPANPVAHLGATKGQADPRPGQGVATGGGGPDLHGYLWTDDDQPGGPVFDWIDTGAGTVLEAGDDESLGPFPLLFPFAFHGQDRDSVRVCTNGFLSFGEPDASHQNQGIPDPAAPNGLIAPFWDDLDPGLGGEIKVLSATDRFVVEFDAVAHFGRADLTETFQIELRPDGSILFRYAEVGDGGGCTVGLEGDAGLDGLLVLFNTEDYLRPGRVVRCARLEPPSWLQVVPAAGLLPPGEGLTVELQITAPAAPGDHVAWVHLATGDPARQVATVPVTLAVDPAVGARPRDVGFGGAVPNPFNPLTEFRYDLPRTMYVELGIYDLAGRHVRTLVSGPQAAGPGSATWRGRDESGRTIASGTYYARLRAGGRTITRAVTLVR